MFWNETPISYFFSIHGDFQEQPSHLYGKFWSCAYHTRYLIAAQTVFFIQTAIFVLQCKNHAFDNQNHTSPQKVFVVSSRLFSISASYCANKCTCCISSHSLVKYTGCRTSCNFECCIVVLWKIIFLWILPEVSLVKIAVRSSWRTCNFWFLFYPFYFWNNTCAFFSKKSTSEAVSMW